MIMMPYGPTLIITAAHRARRLLAPHTVNRESDQEPIGW